MRYMYTMKCYEEKLNHDTGKWMALEIIILSKISQTQINIMFLYMNLYVSICVCVCYIGYETRKGIMRGEANILNEKEKGCVYVTE